jgi:hypothetical protein
MLEGRVRETGLGLGAFRLLLFIAVGSVTTAGLLLGLKLLLGRGAFLGGGGLSGWIMVAMTGLTNMP